MNPTNAQIQAELDALPDSAFIDGIDQVVGAGNTFRRGDKILTVVGFADRRVWDDASDQWVLRNAAGCRPATPQEIEAAGLATESDVSATAYAVKVGGYSSGYFAAIGDAGIKATTIRSATKWATRREAEESIPVLAEGSPKSFAIRFNPKVVEVNRDGNGGWSESETV